MVNPQREVQVDMIRIHEESASAQGAKAKEKARRRDRERRRAVEETMQSILRSQKRLWRLASLMGREDLEAFVCYVAEGKFRLQVGGEGVVQELLAAAKYVGAQRFKASHRPRLVLLSGGAS